MYYIWSLFLSVVLFAFLQYNEYTKDKYSYNLYTIGNVATIVIMYLVFTIVFYMMFEVDYKALKKIQKGGHKHFSPDPSMLKKIPDNVYTGFSFDPHNISEL